MPSEVDFHKFLVLRTPLLPFPATQDLSEEALRRLLETPLLTEALFIASPDFTQAVLSWQQQVPLAAKDRDKLLLTLRKYILRMAYRCTPFGLFAGISRAGWGPATTLSMAPRSEYIRHTRLDMDYLSTVAKDLVQDPAVRKELRYFPNNTLYRIGDHYRYVEVNFVHKFRKHRLVTIDASDFLAGILLLARAGATAYDLAQSLVDDTISQQEAQAFLEEVIDAQVLVSELEPALTGPEYLSELIGALRMRVPAHPTLGHLEAIAEQLRGLDKDFLGNSPAHYQPVLAHVQSLDTTFEPGRLFQLDMRKPTVGHALNVAVQEQIQQTIALLHGVSDKRENETLVAFRTAFAAMYEGQEIPFTQALDVEMGLGYPLDPHSAADPAPLLHNVPLDTAGTEGQDLRWSAWQKFLLDKYLLVIKGVEPCVTLQRAEVEPFFTQSPRLLPTSLYCTGSILAASTQALDAGDFTLVHQLTGGPSAANLLSRFCHLDPVLTEHVQEALAQEERQQPEAVFAEIVHINQSRTANITTRPALRAYEIPILMQSGVDEAHTITLDDLLLSVQAGQLVLRSKRLNRQVIPRLSTAHNFSQQTLPAYHFLCDLQSQHVIQRLSWDWGVLRNAEFLPRVCYGKTILSPARWLLKPAELATLEQLASADLVEKVGQLREQRGLPAWIIVTEGDNKLPINLASLPHLQVLQSVLRRRSWVSIEECLFDDTTLAVAGPEGCFTNEFIFPLQLERQSPERSLPARQQEQAQVLRSFFLGSEWLYLKLYCGPKTADQLLTDVIWPLTQRLRQRNLIDQWFFIRYRDPDQHLRIRFHGAGTFYSQVIEALHEALHPYQQNGLLLGLRTDTYHRELERYGSRTIAASEALFQHDSEATLQVLALLEGDAGDEYRWLLALRSVDSLLQDFGRTVDEKSGLLQRLQANFKAEFNSTSAGAKKAFGTRYRQERARIEDILRPELEADHELAAAAAVFKARTQAWAPAIEAILTGQTQGVVEVPLEELLGSYIHMSLNRLFRSKQRMHEAVLYDFLYQYYSSQNARATRMPALPG